MQCAIDMLFALGTSWKPLCLASSFDLVISFNCFTHYAISFHRCIRFTMHQQRHSHCRDLEYNRLRKERPKSCVKRESALSNLPQVPAHTGLAQVLPGRAVARPQSSTVKPSTRHQTSRPQLRAKSAHPRLLQAPKYVHTNASTKQLQVSYVVLTVS